MPKILYLITEDWFFVSHFAPMARAAKAHGFEVVVATRVNNRAAADVMADWRVIEIDSERESIGIFGGFRYLLRVLAVIRRERPDIVHCIALRPILLGGIAAKLAGVPGLVLAPTGLGYLWLKQSAVLRVIRAVARTVVGFWLRGPRTRYLFENRDDPAEFGLGADDADVTIVGGAGVDPWAYPVRPEPPAPPLKVAVVARMIRTKGIDEAIAATRRARELGAAVDLDLYGDPDPANPGSIALGTLRGLAEAGILWRGRTNAVAEVWREHHVAMLLSHGGEGLPRTLLEAAACGRPIVTTDVAGCRELVRNNVEGFLVPVGDCEQAARALMALAGDRDLRAKMGAAAHARCMERFTEAAVTSAVLKVYDSLVRTR